MYYGLWTHLYDQVINHNSLMEWITTYGSQHMDHNIWITTYGSQLYKSRSLEWTMDPTMRIYFILIIIIIFLFQTIVHMDIKKIYKTHIIN